MARLNEEMPMTEELTPKPAGRVRGRRSRTGQAPPRRPDRATGKLAAAALLAGESEGLTRKAVELALVGDPTAMQLCPERILPLCRERTTKFV